MPDTLKINSTLKNQVVSNTFSKKKLLVRPGWGGRHGEDGEVLAVRAVELVQALL